MNATEQKAHRTVTHDLAVQIADLIEVTVSLDQRLMRVASVANGLTHTSQAHRKEMTTLHQQLWALRDDFYGSWYRTTFWGRFRWLVTGR